MIFLDIYLSIISYVLSFCTGCAVGYVLGPVVEAYCCAFLKRKARNGNAAD